MPMYVCVFVCVCVCVTYVLSNVYLLNFISDPVSLCLPITVCIPDICRLWDIPCYTPTATPSLVPRP